MIFLFGEQVIDKDSEEGQFYCPHCEQVRAFQQIHQKTYFTLFFIPLLPLDSFKDYVECRTCHHSFHPSVKEDRQQKPAFHYALRRILADILRTTAINDAHLTLMAKAYQTVTEQTLAPPEIHACLQAARDDPRDLLDYVRMIGKGLNHQGLEKTLFASAQLFTQLAGDAPLPHEYRVMLNQIATELGVGAQGVASILQQLRHTNILPNK